jgi:hypothetical protein
MSLFLYIDNQQLAMLLMVNSMSQYLDITNMLFEFLILLIDNYNGRRKEAIARSMRSAFGVLVKKQWTRRWRMGRIQIAYRPTLVSTEQPNQDTDPRISKKL